MFLKNYCFAWQNHKLSLDWDYQIHHTELNSEILMVKCWETIYGKKFFEYIPVYNRDVSSCFNAVVYGANFSSHIKTASFSSHKKTSLL